MALSSIPLIAWLLAAPMATQVVVGILGTAIACAALFGLSVALYRTVKYVHNRFFKKEKAVVDKTTDANDNTAIVADKPAQDNAAKPAVNDNLVTAVVDGRPLETVRSNPSNSVVNEKTANPAANDKPVNPMLVLDVNPIVNTKPPRPAGNPPTKPAEVTLATVKASEEVAPSRWARFKTAALKLVDTKGAALVQAAREKKTSLWSAAGKKVEERRTASAAVPAPAPVSTHQGLASTQAFKNELSDEVSRRNSKKSRFGQVVAPKSAAPAAPKPAAPASPKPPAPKTPPPPKSAAPAAPFAAPAPFVFEPRAFAGSQKGRIIYQAKRRKT